MVERKDIERLARIRSERRDILSVYLHTDPSKRLKDECRIALRHVLDPWREEVPEDVERIERYFELEFDWQARGVAVFSSERYGLWEVFALQVPVTDAAYLGKEPYLRPLVNAALGFLTYGVALVDKERMRLYRFAQGVLEKVAAFAGEEVKRHKQGEGRGSSAFQRRADEIAARNMRQAAAMLVRWFEEAGCQGLLLGGTEENVEAFREFLPKSVEDQVLATFSADLDEPFEQLEERVLALVQRLDEERKAKLLAEAVTAAAKGEGGTTGLEDTLALMQQGRVRAIIVHEDYAEPGVRCPQCGFMAASPRECPICGIPMERLADAVEAAFHEAIRQGAELYVLTSDQKPQHPAPIAALLRY